MKKYLPYIIIIGLLVLAAVGFGVAKMFGGSGKEEASFAVENKKDISHIVLTGSDHKVIDLQKSNAGWILNGKYPASEPLVQNLLQTVGGILTRCPVPAAAHDNVIREMLDKNVKVDVYTGLEKKPVITYYVGGPTVNNDGTYMLREVDGKMAQRVFITYMPGVPGYLTPIYNTDEETWRSRLVFNYSPGDIKSISVEYPYDEKKSFTIQRVAGDSLVLAPMDEKFRIAETYQQGYLKQYTGFFSNISLEAFDNTFSKKDSTLQTTPLCIFTITSSSNAVNKVNIYHMPVTERSKAQFDEKGNDMLYDSDHYHAGINGNKDLAIVQYYVFGKLMRSYADFYYKAKPKV